MDKASLDALQGGALTAARSGVRRFSLPRWLAHRGAPLFALLAALALVVAGCGQGGASSHSTTSTGETPSISATTTNGLPVFSDYRVGYEGADGALHIVTLDGKHDLTGPMLPNLGITGLNLASAGASPNGCLFAYGADTLTIISLCDKPTVSQPTVSGVVGTLAWSPDSTSLLYSDTALKLLHPVPLGKETVVPTSGLTGKYTVVGWIDGSHLAIEDYQGVATATAPDGTIYPTAVRLDSLDVTTGALSPIAHIALTGLDKDFFALSPNGAHALFYNESFRSEPYTPTVAVIDIASDAVTLLPRIVSKTDGVFGQTDVAWRPGTMQIAVTSNVFVTPQNWLIDVSNDTATALPAQSQVGFVGDWSPDGRTLVTSTNDQPQAGQGPFTLKALTFSASGQVTVTTLTTSALTFQTVGFIRTKAS